MKKITLILSFLILLVMSSCVVYHPMTADIPLISKKHELRIDAGVSAVPSANTTISYGLTDKIIVQGFGSVSANDMYYFQVAAGLYKNKSKRRVIEFYGGYGYGYGRAYMDKNPGCLSGDYQLYFGQVNFGKISSETSNLETGFGIKSGYLYSNFTDKNYYEMTFLTGPYKTYHDKSILFEPTGFVRFGDKILRFNVKLGGTFIYKLTNRDKEIPYIYLNLGVGLNYRF